MTIIMNYITINLMLVKVKLMKFINMNLQFNTQHLASLYLSIFIVNLIIQLLFIQKMSMFRSQSMSYYQIVIPRQAAWQCINAIGQINSVHIVQSKSLIKPFHQQIRTCDQSIQKISNLESMLNEQAITLHKFKRWNFEYEKLFQYWTFRSYENKKNAISMLDEAEKEISSLWENYLQINRRIQTVKSKLLLTQQNIAVLRASQRVLGLNFYESLRQKEFQKGNLSYKCGIIKQSQQHRFQRFVFRISRGNAFANFVKIQDLFNEQELKKNEQLKQQIVFFILFPSQNSAYLQGKLVRLIESYADSKFELPKNFQLFKETLISLNQLVGQYSSLLQLNKVEKQDFLMQLTSQAIPDHPFTKIQYLKIFILKQKQIYHQLNQMELFNNFIKGQIYIPDEDFEKVHRTILKLQKKDTPSAQIIKLNANKFPTLFKTNDFTGSAQQIVQTYGVAKYKQANPALFTCITFPFLFGVMFGDIMHGLILFAFGLMLIFQKQKYSNHWLSSLIPHRYMITLMGFFSFYCGFVYNDYLSIQLNLFGSCYNPINVQVNDEIPRVSQNCVYPFGIDPVWGIASNGLTFTNSLKMKLAVIIGVVHMTFAVFVKAMNSIYFRNWVDFIFEFLPQLAFMVLLFGYMDFLIIFKWTVDWGYYSPNAPSIISTMINLPLGLGQTKDCCGVEPMWGVYGDTSQNQIQFAFLITSILCIFLMLIPKPIILIYGHKNTNHVKKGQPLLTSEETFANDLARRQTMQSTMHQLQTSIYIQQQHDSSEIIVHQVIQTIQYVLNSISNTASYLRLWALSLAHSQLAEVFFDKTVQGPLKEGYGGIVGMVINFVILSMATFGVLLCMDVMQCFLHALRLHWVQFQNKFYKADGFLFVPCSFTNTISTEMQKQ